MQVPSVAPTSTLSPDGQHMWDGTQWIPVPPSTSDQQTFFLEPCSDYKKLTAQVEFVGNSQLASDMRSIPVGSNPILLVCAFAISFMLILLVVPMVLTVVWYIREGRNKQRRNQMVPAAQAYLGSTPVPSSKQHLASQFLGDVQSPINPI